MSGDDERDLAFAGELAAALEQWLATVQAPPHARTVLEAEIRRLREVAAMQRGRAVLIGVLGDTAVVVEPPPIGEQGAGAGR